MQRLALVSVFALLATPAAFAQQDQPAESADQIRPLLVGSEVPVVEVATLDGQTVDLKSQLAGKPTLLIFYRGGW